MVQIPTLVNDLALTRLTNAVLVDFCKFTMDHFNAFFTGDNPAPSKIQEQLTSFTAAFNALDAAYAVTLRSSITDEIAALDKEGDQLIYAVKGIVEAALRMAFDQTKVEAGGVMTEFMKKYRLDPTENMISEWSKVQQMCEEYASTAALQQAAQTLGIDQAMTRLAAIATELRQKITARSAELPEAQKMKTAREAIYPEYRVLIQLLNAYATVAASPTAYLQLIQTLNNNIDYVRRHAVAGGTGGTGGGSGDGGSSDGISTASGSGSSSSDSGSSSGSGSTSGSGSASGSGSTSGGSSSGGSNSGSGGDGGDE